MKVTQVFFCIIFVLFCSFNFVLADNIGNILENWGKINKSTSSKQVQPNWVGADLNTPPVEKKANTALSLLLSLLGSVSFGGGSLSENNSPQPASFIQPSLPATPFQTLQPPSVIPNNLNQVPTFPTIESITGEIEQRQSLGAVDATTLTPAFFANTNNRYSAIKGKATLLFYCDGRPNNYITKANCGCTGYGYNAFNCNGGFCGVGMSQQLIRGLWGSLPAGKDKFIEIWTKGNNPKCTIAPIQEMGQSSGYTYSRNGTVMDLSACVMGRLGLTGTSEVFFRALKPDEQGCAKVDKAEYIKRTEICPYQKVGEVCMRK